MIFVTGGNSQGKLSFVKAAFALADDDIADGADCPLSCAFDRRALNRLHLLVERLAQAGAEPTETVLEGVRQNPDIILLCDELGCGIVPAQENARAQRERVGRLSCLLAARAERVYRVVCGIPQVMKGEFK